MLRRYLRSMGSCIGYHNRGSRGSESSEDNPSLAHNRPLKHRKPKWKSNIRLTEAQLKAKRDEFWDTAPAFEGRREIWDALKASVSALESGDYQMAQVILDGANISLPNGTLMDCYDELGNQYQLPVYILSAPINMICEGDENNEDDEEAIKKKTQTGSKKEQVGKQINIRIRFSTGDDRKLTVNTSESVAAVKRSLARCTPGIDPNTVRFFFAGKQLHNKMTLSSAKVESNFTIQALILDVSSSNTPALQVIPLKPKDKVNVKSHKEASSSHSQHTSSRHKVKAVPFCTVTQSSNLKMINNCKDKLNFSPLPNTMICSYDESSLENEQAQIINMTDEQQNRDQSHLSRIHDRGPSNDKTISSTSDQSQTNNYPFDLHDNNFPPQSNAPHVTQINQHSSQEKLHQSTFQQELLPEINQSQQDFCQQQLLLEQQQSYPYSPFQNCQQQQILQTTK